MMQRSSGTVVAFARQAQPMRIKNEAHSDVQCADFLRCTIVSAMCVVCVESYLLKLLTRVPTGSALPVRTAPL
jgi:hypothetical protein